MRVVSSVETPWKLELSTCRETMKVGPERGFMVCLRNRPLKKGGWNLRTIKIFQEFWLLGNSILDVILLEKGREPEQIRGFVYMERCF